MNTYRINQFKKINNFNYMGLPAKLKIINGSETNWLDITEHELQQIINLLSI